MIRVLMDMDGPVIDSACEYFQFYERLCAGQHVAKPWNSFEEFRDWVSGDWSANIKRLGVQNDQEAYLAYRRNAQKLKSGIDVVINHIVQAGIHLAVHTGEPETVARDLVAKYQLPIPAVFGADSFAHRKPDPQSIHDVLVHLKWPAAESIYVSDTASDITMARNAQVRSIAVLYGFNSLRTLVAAQPDALAESPESLGDLIVKWNRN